MFDKLGLPVVKKTPSGAPSTDEEVLQELALDYPLPKILLEYRGMAKLKSTYTDKLPAVGGPRDRPRAHQLFAGGGGHRALGLQRSRTCRTFRSGPRKAAASAKPSLRRPAAASCRRITRRSNCASWRICPVMRVCSRHSPTTRTSIAPPLRKYSASHPPRYQASSAATPRSSTSA